MLSQSLFVTLGREPGLYPLTLREVVVRIVLFLEFLVFCFPFSVFGFYSTPTPEILPSGLFKSKLSLLLGNSGYSGIYERTSKHK